MPFNETYGEVSDAELAEMRKNAKTCAECGALATVDPVMHENRYAHAPVYRDGDDLRYYRWDVSTLSFQPTT